MIYKTTSALSKNTMTKHHSKGLSAILTPAYLPYYITFHDYSQKYLQPALFYLEVLDTVNDCIIFYYKPTISNFKEIAFDIIAAYTIYSSFDFILTGIDIAIEAYTIYEAIYEEEESYLHAFATGFLSITYPAIPLINEHTSLMVANNYDFYSAVKIIVAGGSIYETFARMNKFYNIHTKPQQELKSYQIWHEKMQCLANFTNLEFFKIKAQEYSLAISSLKKDMGIVTEDTDDHIKYYSLPPSNEYNLDNFNLSGEIIDY